MVTPADETLMRHALEAAWPFQGLTLPNPAVGAVVSSAKGEILGIGAHLKAGAPHAEVLALKAAYKTLTHDTAIDHLESAHALHDFLQTHALNLFQGCSLHVTLEPCHHHGKTPPCSKLIHALGVSRVVIGHKDASAEARGGGAFLQTQGVEVVYGCLEQACHDLLRPFLDAQKGKSFSFFKAALSLNGVYTGGTISSQTSRHFMHCLRDRCDLLVIGGNTVRIDRPILDARLCQGKAPNVLIYSHQECFDTTIPLWHVPHRKVYVEASLDRMKKAKMAMVEGGEGMLEAIRDHVKWYLIFQSSTSKEGKTLCLPQGLRLVHTRKIGEDKLTWYWRDDG